MEREKIAVVFVPLFSPRHSERGEKKGKGAIKNDWLDGPAGANRREYKKIEGYSQKNLVRQEIVSTNLFLNSQIFACNLVDIVQKMTIILKTPLIQ